MFGANYFGQSYFGQAYPQKATTSLAAMSTIALSTVVSLTITPTLSAASTIGVETTAALNVFHPLAASSEIDISTTALLSGATSLAASSSIQFSTTAARPVMTANLSASSAISLAVSGASYAQQVIEDAAYVFLRFGEAGGATTAVDSSGNGRSGTYNSGAAPGSAGVLADGNGAADFSGAANANVTNTNSLAGITAAASFEAFVNPDTLTGGVFKLILSSSLGTSYIAVDSSNAAFASYQIAGIQRTLGGSVLTTGSWWHIVSTYDGDKIRVYVNGNLVNTSASFVGALGFGGGTWRVGTNSGGSEPFDGRIDEVAIYNYALSAGQIANHYALRLADATSALLPNLRVGGIPLSNTTTAIGFSTQALLSGLAAQLAASSSIQFSTVGSIALQGPSATSVVITFNGVTQTANRIRKGSLTITDALNESPNTCDFIVDGTPPAIGTDVKIGLSNVLPGSLIFAGTVQRVDQKYLAGKNTIPSWTANCQDYTYLINRRLVVGSWTNVSATTVAFDIVTKNAPGFSIAGIANGLPQITVSFAGVPVMAALAEIANLIGGYSNVDYGKVVRLFVTDTTDAPTAITGPGGFLQNNPPITVTSDESQLRTRVITKGQSSSVSGPAGFNLPSGSSQIPIDKDVSPWQPSGQGITVADEIISYTGTAPGGVASTVRGNVPAPAGSPTAVLASGVAGGLSGTYNWKVAFANAGGETEVGPASLPLFAPAVSPPGFAPGVGQPANQAIGPLVGTYQYWVSFVTTLGETLRSPLVSRSPSAVTPPANPIVGDGPAAGNLIVGATYRYAVTFVTQYGETTAGTTTAYVPSALQQASLSGATGITFGGVIGGPYIYGVSIVTDIGESSPPVTLNAGSSFATSGPSGFVSWAGQQDSQGRIAPGLTYIWAASYYSDRYGETPLGGQFSLAVGGALTIRLLMNIPLGLGLPFNCDGIRIYRAISGGGGSFQLNADYRAGSVPTQYWDTLSQGECGNPWPVHPIRAGQSLQWTVGSSAAPSVLARRLYRSKSGGSELYLIGEIQHNITTTFIDSKFDADLTARNPVTQTTGRQGALTAIALSSRPGVIARRIYRTQANGSIYYMITEIKDNTTTAFADNIPDSALTSTTLTGTNTAGGDQHLLTSVPLGPAGTLARKIYRTIAGGTEPLLVGQISDNTSTTFLDTVPDANLGQAAPLTNTAGASAVTLTVPTGGAGVTQRVIYRTSAGGTDFKYVGTINDNSTTTFLDDKADSSLGRLPQTTSTIGALAGDATVLLQSSSGWPASGWFDGDGQIIRYNGISGNALTGIPPLLSATITRSGTTATATAASPHGYTTGQRIVILGADQPEYTGSQTVTVTGPTTFTYDVTGTPVTPATGTIKISQPGAIIGALAGGSTVTTIPMLTGVSGLITPIAAGSQIALWVVRNSASGQSTIAASEGGDGIHEFLVSDGSLDSVAACQKRADAELALFQFARVQVTYTTRDTKTKSGKTIHIALGSPQNISGDFLIQNVKISEIDVYPRLAPKYEVMASNTKFSLQDVLRHVVLDI